MQSTSSSTSVPGSNKSSPKEVKSTPNSSKRLVESREDAVDIPKEYCDTYVVRKPMGARVHKRDFRITHIDGNSAIIGKIFVGDIIIALDNQVITNNEQIHQKLREPTEKVAVRIRHGMWSWCQHRCTTLERIQMDKDTEKVTGRPIDLYYVAIQMSYAPESAHVQLGLYVKYDARERLQVHNVESSSIAAVHLRPGDVIREVNDKPVASKTMLKYYITEAMVKRKKICFLIECPSGEPYRDSSDMAPDVTEIAARQIEILKKHQQKTKVNSVYSSKRARKNVSIAAKESAEVEIAADFDPAKLRPCKNAK